MKINFTSTILFLFLHAVDDLNFQMIQFSIIFDHDGLSKFDGEVRHQDRMFVTDVVKRVCSVLERFIHEGGQQRMHTPATLLFRCCIKKISILYMIYFFPNNKSKMRNTYNDTSSSFCFKSNF